MDLKMREEIWIKPEGDDFVRQLQEQVLSADNIQYATQ
jgi:hypothetical protein